MEWADHIYAHKCEEEKEKLNQATSENASCEENFHKADVVNKNSDEQLAHALHEQEREKVKEEKQKEEEEFQKLQV